MDKIDIKSVLLGFFMATTLFLLLGADFRNENSNAITTNSSGKHIYATDGHKVLASHDYGKNWEVVKY